MYALIPATKGGSTVIHDMVVTFRYNDATTTIDNAVISGISYNDGSGAATIVLAKDESSITGPNISVKQGNQTYLVFPDSFVMIPNGSRITRTTMDWGRAGDVNGIDELQSKMLYAVRIEHEKQNIAENKIGSYSTTKRQYVRVRQRDDPQLAYDYNDYNTADTGYHFTPDTTVVGDLPENTSGFVDDLRSQTIESRGQLVLSSGYPKCYQYWNAREVGISDRKNNESLSR